MGLKKLILICFAAGSVIGCNRTETSEGSDSAAANEISDIRHVCVGGSLPNIHSASIETDPDLQSFVDAVEQSAEECESEHFGSPQATSLSLVNPEKAVKVSRVVVEVMKKSKANLVVFSGKAKLTIKRNVSVESVRKILDKRAGLQVTKPTHDDLKVLDSWLDDFVEMQNIKGLNNDDLWQIHHGHGLTNGLLTLGNAQPGQVRVAKDAKGTIQAAASVTFGSKGACAGIAELVTRPGNLVLSVERPGRVKHSAKTLLAEILREQIKQGGKPCISLKAFPQAVEAYKKMGFQVAGMNHAMRLDGEAAQKLLSGL